MHPESGSQASVVQTFKSSQTGGVPLRQFPAPSQIAIPLHASASSQSVPALAGVLVLSGYQVLPDCFAAEAVDVNKLTPVTFCHGRADPLVPIERGRKAHDVLAGWLVEETALAWHEFDMEHELCPDETMVIRDWLHTCFEP